MAGLLVSYRSFTAFSARAQALEVTGEDLAALLENALAQGIVMGILGAVCIFTIYVARVQSQPTGVDEEGDTSEPLDKESQKGVTLT